MQTQDFDKLEGILKDYKRFMSESPHVDASLPNHAHLGGFASDGLHIHVHVCSCSAFSSSHTAAELGCICHWNTPTMSAVRRLRCPY